MSLATILRSRNARRWPASRKRPTTKPRLERLEERLALSGFGPEDGAYILEPWLGHYHYVQIQPGDQKIVAAGLWATDSSVAVARYDSLGHADGTYGNGGLANPPLGPTSENALSLVLQPDGKAVVAGYADSPGALGVARLNANGSPDSGFGSGGWTTFDAQPGRSESGLGVGLQSTGKIIVGGRASELGSSSALVARFKTDGTIDSGKGGFGQVVKGKATGATLSTFGSSPSNGWADVAIRPDDKVVAVGGNDITGNGDYRMVVARYTASGTVDTTFNGTGYVVFAPAGPAGFDKSSGGAVALQADGKIVVAGQSYGSTDGLGADMLIARFHANGTLDTGFGGGSGYVRLDVDATATFTSECGNDLVIQPDGKIVVVGETFVYGSSPTIKVLVARFNPDGTPDQSFATDGFRLGAPAPDTGYVQSNGNAVTLQSDGSIIVAGFTQALPGGLHHPLLMRFFGSPPSPLVAAGGIATTPANSDSLTLTQVQPVLTEAIARWQATGADVSRLESLDVRIADLPAATLGMAAGNTITLDVNAAGWGWFVDSTPEDDSEFALPGNQGEQHRMDLLTVIMHELGHVLEHAHDADGVMAETLVAGVRRTALEHDHVATIDQLFAQSDDHRPDAWLGIWLTEHLESAQPWAKRRR